MRKAAVLVATLSLGLGLWAFDVGCQPSREVVEVPAPDAGLDPYAEPITFGVNLSLTGSLAAFGQAEQNTTKVAENLINSYGGVLGRQVKFTIVDDATFTMTSTANMSTFLGQALPVLMGPTGSGQAVPDQMLAAMAKIPLISPSASTPDTHNAEPATDRYFFRTAASHSLQAKALALRVFSGFTPSETPDGGAGDGGDGGSDAGAGGRIGACHHVAVIHADDSYGDPIATGIATEITSIGGDIAIDVKVPNTAKASYDAEVASVIAAHPDCQILVSFPDVGVGYMRSFKKAIATDTSRDWSTFLSVGSNGLATSSFLKLGLDDPSNPASATIAEGMYIMNLDLNPDTPQYREFKNLFTLSFPLAAGQTDLSGYTANQFDAAILACLAIQKAGTATDSVKIRDALFDVSRPPGTAFSPAHIEDALEALRLGQDIDYDGASGPVDFDEYGEVLASYVVYSVQGGKLVLHPGDTVKVDDLK